MGSINLYEPECSDQVKRNFLREGAEIDQEDYFALARYAVNVMLSSLWPETEKILQWPHWLALYRLYNNPYWRRIWIVQEICLARQQIQIFLGAQSMPFSDLIQASLRIRDNKKLAKGHMGDALVRTREENVQLDPWVLVSHLGYIRNAELKFESWAELAQARYAIDPLDKVYALAGLLPSTVTNGMTFDYNAKAHRIYTEFARSLINSSGSLELLAGYITNPVESLPSWVPNLEVLDLGGHAFKHKYFDAPCSQDDRPQAEGNVLCVTGCVIDAIDGLGIVPSSSDRSFCDHYHGRTLTRGLVQATAATQEEPHSYTNYSSVRRRLGE
jgi:hypothetical protein